MLKWVRLGYKEGSWAYSWILDEKCENEVDAEKEVVNHSKIFADMYNGLYTLADSKGKVLARWKFKNGKLYKEKDRDPSTLPFFLRKLREMLEKRWEEVLPGGEKVRDGTLKFVYHELDIPKARFDAIGEVILTNCFDKDKAEDAVIRHFREHKGINGYYILFGSCGDIITTWQSSFKYLYRIGLYGNPVTIAWL